MGKHKVKYVQLEAMAFLGDKDCQIMTNAEFGAYCRLIFNLYDSGGKLEYNIENLRKLAKANDDLNFDFVMSKFQVRRGFIYHKRVTKELRKAQLKQASAVKAAKAKWEKQCGRNADAERAQSEGNANGREGKGIEEYTNTKDNTISKDYNEQFLFLCKRMTLILQPTQKDAWVLAEIAKFLKEKNPQYLTDAIEWLEIASHKLKPIAYFIKTIQRETGWKAKMGSAKTLGKNTSSLGEVLTARKIQGKL